MKTYTIIAVNKNSNEIKDLGDVVALSSHLAVRQVKALGYGNLYSSIYAVEVVA